MDLQGQTPLFQDGTLNTLHLKTSPQGSWWITTETLLPFIKIVDTRNKLAGALVNTLPTRTKREEGLVMFKL